MELGTLLASGLRCPQSTRHMTEEETEGGPFHSLLQKAHSTHGYLSISDMVHDHYNSEPHHTVAEPDARENWGIQPCP